MNTFARFSVLAASSALALGSIAACDSDSDDSKDAAPRGAATAGVQLPTVSSAVFADQGNAICRSSASAIGDRFRAMSTPPTPAELTAAYDNMLKESYKLVGELLAVGPPAGQERQLLDLLVQQYKITETVEKQGQEQFFANEDSDPWEELSASLVGDFGLTDCAHGG